MKKRLFILCMIALVAFSFIGCDDKKPEPATPEEKVLAGEIYIAIANAIFEQGYGKTEYTFEDVDCGSGIKLNGTCSVKDNTMTYNVTYGDHTAEGSFTEGAKSITVKLDGKDIIIDIPDTSATVTA